MKTGTKNDLYSKTMIKPPRINYNISGKINVIFLFITVLFFSNKIFSQELSKSDTSNVRFLNARKFFIYKVEKGETLYGISQKFNIPQEEISHFNHEIEKSGLKPKMKLWIPAYSWLKKDSVPEKIVEIEKPTKSTYHIAIVTSLNLPKIYMALDTSVNFIEELLKKETKDNLEFVEGILHSAEKLKAEGLKVHLYIIDSETDSLKVLIKLRKKNEYNLIITNEGGNILRSISNFSKNKNIKLLSCGINTIDIIKNNKEGLSLIPSSGQQCEQMGKFAGEYFKNANLITVKTSTSKENERTVLFLDGWKKSQHSTMKQLDYLKDGSNGISEILDKKATNVIFISSSNEDMVSDMFAAISSKIPDYDINIIGLPTWQYFETIDQKLVEKCNVFLFSSGFINYSSPDVLQFRKYFREKYNIEPAEVSFQAYDAFLFAGKSFLQNGLKMIDESKPSTIKGIFSEYTFVRTSPEQAFENQKIHVFQPAKDINFDIMDNFIKK